MSVRIRRGGRGRYGSFRLTRTRKPLPIVVVVCDDTKTAGAYFYELKREVKEWVTVDVVPAPRDGASARAVVTYAQEQKKARVPMQRGDSVWALIDLEGEPDRQRQALQAKKQGADKGVEVALSNPCYEVWTLAHLVDTGKLFKDCEAVVDRIKAEWKRVFGSDFGKKAQADYSRLMQYREDAARRAKRRSAKKDQSWTEVFKVVEAIIG